MTRKRKPFITAALCAVAFGRAWAQAPRVATVRYILFATLSAIAFGQSPESDKAVDPAASITALAAKVDRLARVATNSAREDDNKNKNDNGSPVLLQQVTRRSVQWTKTKAVCSSLLADLTGSGPGRTTVTLVRNADGTFNYKTNDEVSGIATDTNNRHYIFLYVNNAFVDSGTGIPTPRAPYNVYGTDSFQLIPVDGGTGYTTNIFFKLRINADGSFTDQGSIFTPNAFCDPI
jgi:hypothetical protein